MASITPTNPPCAFKVYVTPKSAGVLTAVRTNGTTTINEVLNNGNPLTAGAEQIFTILVNSGDSINFQYSISTTFYAFFVNEVDLNTSQKQDIANVNQRLLTAYDQVNTRFLTPLDLVNQRLLTSADTPVVLGSDYGSPVAYNPLKISSVGSIATDIPLSIQNSIALPPTAIAASTADTIVGSYTLSSNSIIQINLNHSLVTQSSPGGTSTNTAAGTSPYGANLYVKITIGSSSFNVNCAYGLVVIDQFKLPSGAIVELHYVNSDSVIHIMSASVNALSI